MKFLKHFRRKRVASKPVRLCVKLQSGSSAAKGTVDEEIQNAVDSHRAASLFAPTFICGSRKY